MAGPQASAAVLAALPVLGVALGSAMGADPLGILFGTARPGAAGARGAAGRGRSALDACGSFAGRSDDALRS